MVDPKYLREYRCPDCNKLLCKGYLHDGDSALEVKCRNCKKMCWFTGEDAHILKERSVLIKQGLVPDTDTVSNTAQNSVSDQRMLQIAFLLAASSVPAIMLVSQMADNLPT